MTRRTIKGEYKKVEAYHANGGWVFVGTKEDGEDEILKPAYEIGESVAIAQAYWRLKYKCLGRTTPNQLHEQMKGLQQTAGWKNKMFVKAEYMRYRIRIKNAYIEKLQDISDEDCLREGIVPVKTPDGPKYVAGWRAAHLGLRDKNRIARGEVTLAPAISFKTPKDAFAKLIDYTSGKGTWDRNPYVWVYEFEVRDYGQE